MTERNKKRKAQFNLRISDLTREQVNWLSVQFGCTLTEALTLCVERVYSAERIKAEAAAAAAAAAGEGEPRP